ncbi:MAG TPA: hypothetical protein DCS66_14970 [Flavobacteriaceae bacterium]|nr:hypothetical protein [Flavobacteriaceae bacterium]
MNEVFCRVDENGIISFGGMCAVKELPNQFNRLKKLLEDNGEEDNSEDEEVVKLPKKKFSLSLGKKK